jgi:hypothetical protein
MSSQADELRAKASALFGEQHRSLRHVREPDRRVIAELPNGFSGVIRVGWGTAPSGAPELKIAAYERAPNGDLYPISSIMRVNLRQIPGLAHALGNALDDLEVSDRGLQLRVALPCGGDLRNAPAPAITDGRSGR